MKILHLVQNYHPSIGGSQDMIRQFSERMANDYGDQVTVFTTDALRVPTDPQTGMIETKREMIGGVEVRRFPFVRSWRKPLALAQRLTKRMSGVFGQYVEIVRMGPFSPAMLYAISNADVDVICGTAAPYLHMFYPGIAAALGKGAPFVCYGALHLDTPVPEPVLRMIRNADIYAAHTTFERNYLIEHGVAPHKIRIVGAGVDPTRFENGNGQRIRDAHGLGNAPVVGFIGRQAAHKGIDTLIRAMRSVWKRIPTAHLLIAGAPTAYAPTLEGVLAELAQDERARTLVIDEFTDDEKPDLMGACDVFVSVSRAESFGIVYLEAWASGKPVLAGRIGAVQSLVEEGVDGLTIEIGNVDQLAGAVVRLLEDPELRTAMGRHGRAKVLRHYTWDIVTAKLRAIYEELARGRQV